ncbi:hypothetical protein FRC12_010586 [Ceratobasidium sp. 428]|nr:hypothetical protein FRC12_010586 [Ceratobasidium sp. 428]
MPPICAETASVVSLPPRERRAAQRRAHTIKLGLPPLVTMPPTLAATRKRRAGADQAYLVWANGFHVKHVIRRPATPEPVPLVAYLPGQEDIPHSDTKFDNLNNATATFNVTTGNAAHTIKSTGPDSHFDVAAEADDLLDYDAEGKDDDEQMDIDMDFEDFTVSGQSSRAIICSPLADGVESTGNFHASSAQHLDLLANTSVKDIWVLFSGFDSLRFDERPASLGNNIFSGDLTNFNSPAAHGWNDIDESFGSNSPVLSGTDLGSGCFPPLPASETLLHPPLPPLCQIPTPALWIATPEVQIPTPIQPPSAHTPQSQAVPPPSSHQATPQTPARGASTPFSQHIPRSSPLFAHPRPWLSTSEPASQIRNKAGPLQSSRLSLTFNNPADGVQESNSLDGSEAEDTDSDEGQASTPVAFEDTDIGLDESLVLPAHLTQAKCQASRWLNPTKIQAPLPPNGKPIVPTRLKLQANGRSHFKLTACRSRFRGPIVPPSPHSRAPLRSSEMTSDQHVAMGPVEYHVYKHLLFINLWPQD